MYYRYYHDPCDHNTRAHYGVRTRTHKLIYFWKKDQWELFHVDKDRSESTNLADQHPEKVEALVKAWFEEAEKNKVLPVFGKPQLALDGKTQRIQGFMMPLQPGEKQSHFLFTSVPMTCAFCTPGGPESMVEVKTKTPVAYSLEPVTVEGKFAVLADDPYGLYYRVTDAVAVK